MFRLLIQSGSDGMAAGELARAIDIPNSSLSFHLGHLQRSGLIAQRRAGRSIIYSANYRAMDRLVAYLMENCCGGAGCAPSRASTEKEKV
ncbi:MAG: helix-turn-helix domain-containing protein [Hyphomicrobium sp.]|nr:helix-turn-helix domain-containing protein [Hyphomicrobium sp.]